MAQTFVKKKYQYNFNISFTSFTWW